MGVYDTSARRAAKRDGASFFRWALPRLDPALAFAGWLDARTVPLPPESELTCDALAEFGFADRPEEPWIVVAEFQTEPRGDDLERLMEYGLRFRRERRPASDPRLKSNVGGLLLNLTGPEQPESLAMPLPGMSGYGLSGRVVRLAVREQDSVATLARIAAKELSPCILPWVALMRGSGETVVLDEWKRLADLEPNLELRLEYAADALIFSELTGVQNEWKKALEGWNVRVSQQVLEWKAETRQEDLLRLLEKRFKTAIPSDLVETIQATQDMSLLLRWFDFAFEVNSLDEFRASMRP